MSSLSPTSSLSASSLWRLHLVNQIHARPARFEHEASATLIRRGYLVNEGRFGTEQHACLFAMKFNADGSCLGLPSAECAEVWDYSKTALLYTLQGHQEIITSIIWREPSSIPSRGLEASGDHSSRIALTSALDKTIRVWRGPKCTAVLSDHRDWIRCLALSLDNQWLVSGCVSSVLCIWDAEENKLVRRINDAHRSQPDLNTINSLSFSKCDPNVFASGGRDGLIKLWDTRTSCSASDTLLKIRAHSAKLNSAQFGIEPNVLLSSGRDSSIRLWDLRFVRGDASSASELGNAVRSYSSHKCGGYNVAANFFLRQKYIVSGSEDRCVYIYETQTGKLIQRSPPQSAVVHLVEPIPNWPALLSSCIDTSCVTKWETRLRHAGTPPPISDPAAERNNANRSAADLQRDAIEMLLSKYGDQLMRLFHQHNFAFSRTRHWTSLFAEMNPNDASSIELSKMLASMTEDLARAMQAHADEQGGGAGGGAGTGVAVSREHEEEDAESENDSDGDGEEEEERNEGEEDDTDQSL